MTAVLPRLSMSTLGQRRTGVTVPTYDRAALDVGIVHLGLGAFVRGHMACYTDDALALQPGAWGIVGVSLKRPDQRDRLAPQDALYTTLQRSGAGVQARIVFCLKNVLVAPEDPTRVLAAMATTGCRIVSLTVTEKGYCHDPATGRLDAAHPDIVHDLAHPLAPRSAVGMIVAALACRRAAGLPAFTVLCCDNLPHNGRLLAGLVHAFATLRDTRLAAWIVANATFPCTMVDRIVPATTDADIADAAEATGLFDAAPVSHEPFAQWVIEDRFVGDARPAWNLAGAEMVADVAPHEHMKLRMLNASHSALAYLGYLAGHDTIADTVADPVFAAYVHALWANEIIPVVPAPEGVDLNAYAAQLHARYANPAMRHRTWQIAMDGSQKLPQRLLGSIRERLAKRLPIPCLALAVAAWIRYVGGTDEAGHPIDVRDPLAGRLRDILAQANDDPEAQTQAVLNIPEIFGTDLPHAQPFQHAVTTALTRLHRLGARAATAAICSAAVDAR